jgi:hypothetical protein
MNSDMKKVKTRAFSRFNANRAPSYGGTERRRGLQAQGEFFYARRPPQSGIASGLSHWTIDNYIANEK